MKTHPVAVIGAGPVGLAAAAHLSERKIPFILFEHGKVVGENIRNWQHVSMFSPWKYNIDAVAERILKRRGWLKPDNNRIPTGADLLKDYLIPLSVTPELEPYLRFESEVVGISKKRLSKIKSQGRSGAPFSVHISVRGNHQVCYAQAVIDASGTWHNQNFVGADGLPAEGELSFSNRIYYGIPNVQGNQRERYLDKNVVVVGSGHSAINALLDLADLKASRPLTELVWLLRKANVEDAYGGLDNDQLPGRGRVGQRIKALVEKGVVKVITPFFVEKIMQGTGKAIAVSGESTDGNITIETDEIIAATGLRPDLNMLSELRIAIDNAIESPIKLAPLIDPNVHSCGSVQPHGEEELNHPEQNFYIVGMKSYGRAPTFLLATGYEQVRSVVAGLAGDLKAAKEVHLELPETGVCGVPASVDPNNLKTTKEEDKSGCCTPAVKETSHITQ